MLILLRFQVKFLHFADNVILDDLAPGRLEFFEEGVADFVDFGFCLLRRGDFFGEDALGEVSAAELNENLGLAGCFVDL